VRAVTLFKKPQDMTANQSQTEDDDGNTGEQYLSVQSQNAVYEKEHHGPTTYGDFMRI
jgi:hypothetical protein